MNEQVKPENLPSQEQREADGGCGANNLRIPRKKPENI